MKNVVFWSYTILSLSVAIPTAVVVTTTDLSPFLGTGEPSEKDFAWVYSPAFAIKDINGAIMSYSIAFKLSERGEVNSLCKWMPVIRDSMNSTLANTHRVFHEDGRPDTRPLLADLKGRIHSILIQHTTKQIGIVPADKVPSKPDGPDSVAVCYNDRVYEAGRRGPNTQPELGFND